MSLFSKENDEHGLNLSEPPSGTSPNTLKMVLIAAIVSLVVGCLPALGTALVVSHDFDNESRQRSYENCLTLRDGRIATNKRQKQNRLNLQADIDLWEFVLNRPRDPQEQKNLTPAQMKAQKLGFAAVKKLINVKKNKILPLTQPSEIPDCVNQFHPPNPEAGS